MLTFTRLFTGVFRTLLRSMSRKVVGVVEMEDLQTLPSQSLQSFSNKFKVPLYDMLTFKG